MKINAMNDIRPLLRYWIQRLGWLVLTGITLIGIALVFYALVGKPEERHLRELQLEVTPTSSSVKQRSAWRPESPRVAQLNFYRTLSPEKSMPDLMEKIFDAAYANDLFLDQGQFKRLPAQDGVTFSQYQMVLPMFGGYTEIRNFVNQVLQEIPTAALEGINFSRSDAKAPEVEAKVRFTVYLKAVE